MEETFVVAGELVLGLFESDLLFGSRVPLTGLLWVNPSVNGLLKGRGIRSRHVQGGTVL